MVLLLLSVRRLPYVSGISALSARWLCWGAVMSRMVSPTFLAIGSLSAGVQGIHGPSTGLSSST